MTGFLSRLQAGLQAASAHLLHSPHPRGLAAAPGCSRFRRAVTAPAKPRRLRERGRQAHRLGAGATRALQGPTAVTELSDTRSHCPNCQSGVEASAADRLLRAGQPKAGTGPTLRALLRRLSGPPHGHSLQRYRHQGPQRPQDGSPVWAPGRQGPRRQAQPRALLALPGTDQFPAKRISGRHCRLKRGSVCSR